MKLKIEQQKLDEILNYLSVGGIYPFVSLTVKKAEEGHQILSIQETPEAGSLRYFQITDEPFESVSCEGDKESVKFEVAKLHKLISKIPTKQIITISLDNEDQRLIIDSENITVKLNLIDSSVNELPSLPFSVKKGIPHLKNGSTPLDNHVSIPLKELKMATEYASALDTKFYRFNLTDTFTIKVGDLESHAESATYRPEADIKNHSDDVSIILTQAINELANTLGEEIGMRMKNELPVWFYEKGEHHRFGLLLSPHQESE